MLKLDMEPLWGEVHVRVRVKEKETWLRTDLSESPLVLSLWWKTTAAVVWFFVQAQ